MNNYNNLNDRYAEISKNIESYKNGEENFIIDDLIIDIKQAFKDGVISMVDKEKLMLSLPNDPVKDLNRVFGRKPPQKQPFKKKDHNQIEKGNENYLSENDFELSQSETQQGLESFLETEFLTHNEDECDIDCLEHIHNNKHH